MHSRFPAFAILAATGALLAGQASADFTTVNPPPTAGELGLADILSGVYGGTFVASGNDFTNGTVSAIRVNDDLDQLFPTNTYSASAKAVYADFGQRFGYLPGADGSTYVNLFDVDGDGFAVTGAASDVDIDGPFRFARNGDLGLVATSDPADNPDAADHLVTYLIDGLDTTDSVAILAFEDRVAFDFDFNDLVVEVTTPGATVIPSPAALGGGLMLLTGLVARRRRKN